MKKIVIIFVLFCLSASSTTVAQKTVTSVPKKILKQANPLSNFVIGTWKVSSVNGQMFMKIDPASKNEMPVPLGLWVGKNFVFSKNNLLTIKDEKKTYFSGTYILNDNKISIPKNAGNLEMIIEKNGSNIRLSQTPDTFYSMLTQQSNQSLEQVKKMFRIPQNIIFNLSK